MPGVGGDLKRVFIKRPDGQTRSFTVASGGDFSRKNGGLFTETAEPNGDGSTRDIMRNAVGEREVILDIDDRQGDHEWILEASRALEKSTVQYSHNNGSVYSHQAKPTGDMIKNDGNSTCTVTFMGNEIKPE